jgi:site-specific DNA recombinase
MTTMAQADTIRAALYQRVSGDDQEAERQNEANRLAAEREGWQAAEYNETALSASRFAGRRGGASREVWRAILADIAAGEVDVLVLWEPSRGDRQLTGWSALLDACRSRGVLIHVTSHHHTYDLANPREWRALAEDGIDSAYESEKLSVRIKDGKAYWQRKGHPAGALTYGVHRVNAETGRNRFLRNEPDPVTAPVAARIVRAVASDAAEAPFGQIMNALNAEGIPAPKGGLWTRRTIAGIAANPVYAELGIVTEAESLAARARVADPGRKHAKPGQRHRYSQCLHCGVCGKLARGTIQAGKDRYRCPAGHAVISSTDADDFIDRLAIGRLSRPDAIDLFALADDAGAAAAMAEAAGYRTKLAEAKKKAIERGAPDEFFDFRDAWLPKAEAAEKRAAELSTPGALAGLADTDRAVVAGRWESLTLPARKAALRALAPAAVLLPAARGYRVPVEDRITLWPAS